MEKKALITSVTCQNGIYLAETFFKRNYQK